MRIAICDDEEMYIKQSEAVLGQYSREQGIALEIESFLNPMQLMDAVEKTPFDMVLLDIVMPGFNGIETAQQIRRFDQNVQIVFLTSSRDFAVESYEVNATHYLLKPIEALKMGQLLGRLYQQTLRKKEENILVKTKTELVSVALQQVCYCEASKKDVIYALADGRVIKCQGQFFEIAQQLIAHKNFVCVHRSYVVNLDYIERLAGKDILLKNKACIPVARTKHASVKEAYIEYYLKGE